MSDTLRKLNPCHPLDHIHNIQAVAADLLRILYKYLISCQM
jgi:hypothetical protein